jgi:tripartite-type tricarboxylate transporter receptor subunit TctC
MHIRLPLLLAFAIATWAAQSLGQAYPDKPIRLIVPQAAASATDIFARHFTPRMSEILGQPLVVDNRPGAGAIIGTEAVAKAPPDGYTLLLGGSQTHAINKSLYRRLSYDPIADFVPVGRIGQQAMILATNASIPAKSVAELLAYGKANPGKMNFASSGNGSSAHLCGALFSAESGLKAEHVPYKAVSQALADLLSGQVTMMFYPYIALQPHIQSGRILPLGTASEKRPSYLPQVPTMSESGFPSMVLSPWFAFYAPAGTPRRVVDTLYSALERTMNDADVRARLAQTGTEVYLAGPDELRKFNLEEIARYQKIVELSGAKAD